ncbi:MAG: hypothetical protein H0X29_10085 [Parachlamydiaceae bacterium]|nr:hypothetical protein [Parachlamydiaceae bacterium]
MQKNAIHLIGDLIQHPDHQETYIELGSRLRNLNEDHFKIMISSLEKIQVIASILRKGDGEALNIISNQLHLPANIDQVRAIENPVVRIRVMAQLINRDKTALSKLSLNNEEFMLLAPHLTYIDCRDNFNLCRFRPIEEQVVEKGLPEGAAQEFLDACSSENVLCLLISSSEITRLPALPNCVKLICSNNPQLTQLPALPNCKMLNCNENPLLTELPALPSCERLQCYKNPLLTVLPAALPSCEELVCHNNPQLAELPALPNCVTLLCYRNPLLTELPPLPNCVRLECHSNPLLTELPPLPCCVTLECSYCPGLVRLPELSSCETLNCSDCTEFRTLPELPRCRWLNCSGCSELTLLLDLPRCRFLNCSGCSQLTRLPALLNCDDLIYERCQRLDLDSIPHRLRPEPVNIHVVPHELEEDLLSLRVNIKELNENPIKILFEITPQLLKGGSLPHITFIEADGQESQGLDVMGLRRSFVSRLMSSLVSHAGDKDQLRFITGDLGMMPFIDSSPEATEGLEDQIKGFRTLGALLVRSLEEKCTTGNIFDPTLFRMISAFSYEELFDIVGDAGNLSDTLRLSLSLVGSDKLVRDIIGLIQEDPSKLSDSDYEKLKKVVLANLDEDEKIPDLKENSLDNKIWVQAKAKKSLLGDDTREFDTKRAVAVIAKQMCSLKGSAEEWDSLCELGSERLQNRIEGSLSNEKFMSAIAWDPEANVAGENVEKIKDFVSTWVKESKVEDLINLVFTITGSNTLFDDKVLRFEIYDRSAQQLPVVHSCFSSIEISANCPDYETFKEKLEYLITQSTNNEASGFQFT